HNLASLQPREAFVMVKCAMVHPEKIRTLDNPPTLPRKFAFDESYNSLDALSALQKERRAEWETKLQEYLQRLNDEQKQRRRARSAQDQKEDEKQSDEPPPLDLPPD